MKGIWQWLWPGAALGLVLSAVPSIAAAAAAGHAVSAAAQRSEVRIPIRNFSLVDQNGNPFSFDAIKGKVIIANFAYTTCPDVCPLLTAAMRRIQENLSPTERRAVYLLTVTTDPEIDDSKLLAAYAKRNGANLSNWSFLTGPEASLQPVWKNFGVGVRKIARGLIDHTPLTAVIDRSGSMRVAYHGAAPDPAMILRDVRSLLAQP